MGKGLVKEESGSDRGTAQASDSDRTAKFRTENSPGVNDVAEAKHHKHKKTPKCKCLNVATICKEQILNSAEI